MKLRQGVRRQYNNTEISQRGRGAKEKVRFESPELSRSKKNSDLSD